MLILKKILFTYFLLFLPFCVFADQNASQTLEQKLQNLNSMQANFKQTVEVSGKGHMRVIKPSIGKMALQRPGKFRWEIQSPNKQLIVADGKNLWIYDVDLAQVSKRAIDYNDVDNPVLLLSGSFETLKKMFKIRQVSIESNADNTVFELKPTSENAMYSSIKLYFDADQLTEIQIKDNLGQRSNLYFSSIKKNVDIPLNIFKFKAPQGVDVIN